MLHEGRPRRECFRDAGVACPAPFIYLPSCDERRRKSIYALTDAAPTIRGYVRPLRATYPFTPRDATHVKRSPSEDDRCRAGGGVGGVATGDDA